MLILLLLAFFASMLVCRWRAPELSDLYFIPIAAVVLCGAFLLAGNDVIPVILAFVLIPGALLAGQLVGSARA